MKYLKLIGVIYFSSFLLSACVSKSQPINDFDKNAAAKARIELALGYLSFHDFTQAKVNLDKALSYSPNYFLVHSVLAYFYQLQGDVILAQHSYEKAISLDNTQGDIKNNYGAFLCGQGDFEKAFYQFKSALSMDNYHHQIDTYENIILCAKAENNPKRYKHYLQLLKNISPERANSLSNLLSKK